MQVRSMKQANFFKCQKCDTKQEIFKNDQAYFSKCLKKTSRNKKMQPLNWPNRFIKHMLPLGEEFMEGKLNLEITKNAAPSHREIEI